MSQRQGRRVTVAVLWQSSVAMRNDDFCTCFIVAFFGAAGAESLSRLFCFALALIAKFAV